MFRPHFSAEIGRIHVALSGLVDFGGTGFPGRCPGLYHVRPFRALKACGIMSPFQGSEGTRHHVALSGPMENAARADRAALILFDLSGAGNGI